MSQLESRTAAKTAAPRRQRPTFALTPELPFRTEVTPLLQRSGCGPLPPRSVPVRSHSLPFVRRSPILGRVRSRIRFVEATPGGRPGAATRWSCSCRHRRSIGRTHHAAPTTYGRSNKGDPRPVAAALPSRGRLVREQAVSDGRTRWSLPPDCSLRNGLSPPPRGGIGGGSDGEGHRCRPQAATTPRRGAESRRARVRGSPITRPR